MKTKSNISNFKLNKFKGIFPMIYCFFNKNNSIDIKAINDQIQLIKNIGSQGIATLGLATEANKLSFQEKRTSKNSTKNAICQQNINITFFFNIFYL